MGVDHGRGGRGRRCVSWRSTAQGVALLTSLLAGCAAMLLPSIHSQVDTSVQAGEAALYPDGSSSLSCPIGSSEWRWRCGAKEEEEEDNQRELMTQALGSRRAA